MPLKLYSQLAAKTEPAAPSKQADVPQPSKPKPAPYRSVLVQPPVRAERTFGGGVEVVLERRSHYVDGFTASDLAAIRGVANRMLGAEKLASRHRRGRYERGWGVEVATGSQGVKITLSNGVPYAGYVAFGTRKRRGHSVVKAPARLVDEFGRMVDGASRRVWAREQAR